MKEKILAELVKKFPGLQKSLLGLIAEKMATKATADDQIEGAISQLENSPISIQDYAAFLQTESDRRVTEALLKKEPKKQDEPPKEKEKEKPAEKPEDVPEWKKEFNALLEKVNAFEAKENAAAVRAKLEASLKSKGIPLTRAKYLKIEKEEDIEGIVTEIEADIASEKQTESERETTRAHRPLSGSGGANNGKATDAEIKAITDKILPK